MITIFSILRYTARLPQVESPLPYVVSASKFLMQHIIVNAPRKQTIISIGIVGMLALVYKEARRLDALHRYRDVIESCNDDDVGVATDHLIDGVSDDESLMIEEDKVVAVAPTFNNITKRVMWRMLPYICKIPFSQTGSPMITAMFPRLSSLYPNLAFHMETNAMLLLMLRRNICVYTKQMFLACKTVLNLPASSNEDVASTPDTGEVEGANADTVVSSVTVIADAVVVYGVVVPVENLPEAIPLVEAETVLSVERGLATLDVRSVEVAQHRRIRAGHKAKYVACVLAECRAVFGNPSAEPANREAIRRFARNVMTKHGVRPSHVAQVLPTIVALAFIPNKHDIAAKNLLNSESAREYAQAYYGHSGIDGGLGC